VIQAEHGEAIHENFCGGGDPLPVVQLGVRLSDPHHCGRSVKRFEVECPCQPVRFPNGDVRYDVQDLDGWLNTLKAGGSG
jgi:hypothetical protein